MKNIHIIVPTVLVGTIMTMIVTAVILAQFGIPAPRKASNADQYPGCTLYINGKFIDSFAAKDEKSCEQQMNEAYEKLQKK